MVFFLVSFSIRGGCHLYIKRFCKYVMYYAYTLYIVYVSYVNEFVRVHVCASACMCLCVCVCVRVYNIRHSLKALCQQNEKMKLVQII